MTGFEIAALLEHFANEVQRLPGISRTRPHAFAEAKSELRGAMLSKALELRTTGGPTAAMSVAKVNSISPGRRTVGSRDVRVERRMRRA